MISRRRFLTSSSSTLFAAGSALFAPTAICAANSALSDGQNKLIDWMDEATGVGKESAQGPLSVTRFADPFWYLTRSITWLPAPEQPLPSVAVPVGFVTDFASIPRALWTALPRDGDYVWPAVVHDYLYWNQTTTKDIADDVLNAAMADFKIPAAHRLAIYQGVRLGGASSWIACAQLRQSGEKRMLKRFPDSPMISWEDWKKRPDVFAD
jgi:hypothetical protein